jgi:TfoX/Sxy family transcriptional regulator of competence genes
MVRRSTTTPRAGRRTPGSLKVTDGFKSFALDQLEELGDVVPKAMFGAVGLYHRDLFFGILARDTLYLKVDDRNLADYQRAGMKPFNPYPRVRSNSRSGRVRRSRWREQRARRRIARREPWASGNGVMRGRGVQRKAREPKFAGLKE